MRTNLIIGEETVSEIQRYAADHNLKFYAACNKLLKLAVGYQYLLGDPIPQHVHKYSLWMRNVGMVCACGAVDPTNP